MTNKERFYSCTIRPERVAAVDDIISRMTTVKEKYLQVVMATGVPWWFISIIHILENGGKFSGHLHNGDPLSGRTVRVPSGRPLAGKPPFTWQESAIDALTMQGLSRPAKEPGIPYNPLSWSLIAALDRMERYNGLGYRRRGLPSPYLWAGSQHYTRGKFVADGKFDPNAISKQIGGAVILKRLDEQKLVCL